MFSYDKVLADNSHSINKNFSSSMHIFTIFNSPRGSKKQAHNDNYTMARHKRKIRNHGDVKIENFRTAAITCVYTITLEEYIPTKKVWFLQVLKL